MNWFISDHDEITIYITNLWAEFYVPKFRISMTVEEPHLYLRWNDRERGQGGDQRELVIDYLDVVDGYGGYVDNPASAAALMADIEAMIVSGFGGSSGPVLLNKGDLLTHDGVSDVIHPAGLDRSLVGYWSANSDGLRDWTPGEVLTNAGGTTTAQVMALIHAQPC